MRILLSSLLILLTNISLGATHLLNAEKIQSILGVRDYVESSRIQNNLSDIRVAILDNGFGELRNVEKTLPSSAKLVEYYPKEMIEKFDLNPSFKGNPLSPSEHGLFMAQMIWGVTGNLETSPKFYLLNANGFTNFRRAVRYAIEQNVDIILYSQNWEYGGNFDGKGFINKVVNQATDEDIIWINAAGNYGGKVWNATIKNSSAPKSTFKEGLVPFTVNLDDNDITLTATWSDFFESEDQEPSTDLDIEILDKNKNIISSSNLAQVKLGESDKRKVSLYAREKFSFNLDKGTYYIKIKYVAGSVDDLNIRLFLDPRNNGATFNKVDNYQEIMIPGDNPNVITVGDKSPQSAKGPTMDGRNKPDIILPISMAQFSNGLTTSGTSNAAAYYAGIAALAKANILSITSKDLLNYRSKETKIIGREVNINSLPYPILESLESYASVSRAFKTPTGRLHIQLSDSPLRLKKFQSVFQDAQLKSLNAYDYRFFLKVDRFWAKAYAQPANWDLRLGLEWIEVSGPTSFLPSL